MNRSVRFAVSLVLLGCAACSRQEAPVAAEPAPLPAASTEAPAPDFNALLAVPDRFAGDSAEDAWRRSPEVLAFLEVEPGEHVLDYLAGGGYYSELLSRAVGHNGRVYAYNNGPYAKYSGDTPAKRYADNRLPNVTALESAPEVLAIEPASLDAVLFVQSYHDLHWKSKDWTPATDPAQSLARVVSALKPGGVVVVVDHVAKEGSDPAVSVDALHRIDPALVKREFEAAGLVFDAESPAFRNPGDDHSKVVFDESIRHKSDQFMYRFRKP